MFASGKSASVSAVANYIEDVFSTYLYTGNGSTQTITNGIDLSTKGGLVWIKRRNDAYSNVLYDTSRGVNLSLSSNTTGANVNQAPDGVSAFNTTGFSLNGNSHLDNNTTGTYVSWTFREQAKFFDIVTYTGTGGARTINHNLGSAAGCIMIKCTSTTSNWMVWHTSISGQNNLYLNSTAATSGVAADPISVSGWPSSTSTTTFTVDDGTDSCNSVGETYVAYLFAHDAGGFGLTGSDNVISCGSYTGDNTSNRAITLGYEPQWILWKSSSYPSGGSETNWQIYDTMRGWLGNATATGADSRYLVPNTSSAEAGENAIAITPTGFTVGKNTGGLTNKSGDTYIYIAIRRGPMKVPTLGTTVFAPVTYAGDNTTPRTITTGIKTDLIIGGPRDAGGGSFFGNTNDRLRGQVQVGTTSTDAETSNVVFPKFDVMAGYINLATGGDWNATPYNYIRWAFQRAPSFFDEVCYTGTGSATTFAHNLGVAPELMIVKCRSNASTEWDVYAAPLGATKYLYLQSTNAQATGTNRWNDTAPTSSVFTVATDSSVNGSGRTYVNYLFATCSGVSKVGSYTGTGTTLQINCGFTAGARFVLIKRTDSTGDWYVWDTARGIVSGNDPYLLLNSTAAEVTSTDYIDAYSAGFEISSTAPSAINASGGTFIFLAIA
jgi:hypothetical protein